MGSASVIKLLQINNTICSFIISLTLSHPQPLWWVMPRLLITRMPFSNTTHFRLHLLHCGVKEKSRGKIRKVGVHSSQTSVLWNQYLTWEDPCYSCQQNVSFLQTLGSALQTKITAVVSQGLTKVQLANHRDQTTLCNKLFRFLASSFILPSIDILNANPQISLFLFSFGALISRKRLDWFVIWTIIRL